MFGKVENGTETMIYYGSLGEQKQYVSAYVEGTARMCAATPFPSP